MTIPTDATHEVSIHDLNVVRVDVRMSALEPGVRAEFERLTAQAHQARRERDAAREGAQDCRDQLDEIRSLLGAGPGVTALEALRLLTKDANEEIAEERAEAGKMRAQRDEATMRLAHAKAERDGARRERDEAREALAKANASLETERIAGRVATEFWQARIATLEAAIRNLAKVLP